MAESMSLLDFLRQLLTNTQLRDSFVQDPQAVLADHGLSSLQACDVHDALVLTQDNQTADFSPGSGTAGHQDTQLPPSPPAHHAAMTEHEAAVQYLNTYVTSNYVDSRSTMVDNSVHQAVDTHGGNFDQNIDVHSAVASGDDAVAAGGDISGSTISSGHGNQIGDGNVAGTGNVAGDHNQAVTGAHDTTSFGAGHATSTAVDGGVAVGSGGAFGSGDGATDSSDHSLHDVANDSSDHSVDHSGNDLSDHGVHDSDNGIDAGLHDPYGDGTHHDPGNSFGQSEGSHADPHTDPHTDHHDMSGAAV